MHKTLYSKAYAPKTQNKLLITIHSYHQKQCFIFVLSCILTFDLTSEKSTSSVTRECHSTPDISNQSLRVSETLNQKTNNETKGAIIIYIKSKYNLKNIFKMQEVVDLNRGEQGTCTVMLARTAVLAHSSTGIWLLKSQSEKLFEGHA